MPNTFYKNFLIMLSGNGLAYLVPFVALPFIGRLYTPESLGQFGLFMTVTGLFMAVGALRYEQAILLPKSDTEALGIIKLGVKLIVFVSTVVGVLMLFFRKFISEFYKDSSLADLLVFVPLLVFLNGIHVLVYNWLNRKKRYKKLATTNVLVVIFMAIVNVGLGYYWGGIPLGLICGYLSSFLVYAFMFRSDVVELITEFKKLPAGIEREQAIDHKDFPLINLPHALSDTLFQQFGINTLFSKYFGVTAFGFFHITQKYVKMPIRLFNASMSQVFFQEASTVYSDGKSFTFLVNKTLRITMVLSFGLFFVLVFFGPQIFSLVMGEDWTQAGIYAQYISPAICFSFLVSPISSIPIICKKQKSFFFFSLAHQITSLLAFFVGITLLNFTPVYSILLFAITSSFFYIIMLIWFYDLSKAKVS